MMPSSTFYEVAMVITDRDLDLFRKLSTYGILSTKLVGNLVFNSIATTTVLRRLRCLEEGFYLKRILGLESQETLWTLTEKAAELAEVFMPKRHWSKTMLEHDFKLLNLRLALEGSGVSHSWLPEHEIRSSVFKKNGIRGTKDKLIPDGLMGIEVDGKRLSVAIELELTLKNKDKLKQIVRKYQDTGGLHAVWYIAPTASILNAVFQEWHKGFGSDRFYFYASLLDQVMKNPLEAKLMGEKPHRLVREAWTVIPAHPPAQGVSILNEKIIEPKLELTIENHTPFFETVSC